MTETKHHSIIGVHVLTGGAIALEMPARAIDGDWYLQFAGNATARRWNNGSAEAGSDLWIWSRFAHDVIGYGFDRLAPRMQPEDPIWHDGNAQQLGEHLLNIDSALNMRKELLAGTAFLALTRIESLEPHPDEIKSLAGAEALARLNTPTRPRRKPKTLRQAKRRV
jgi:hypothetical protein